MPVRHADAEWTGGLSQGRGVIVTGTGSLRGGYSYMSRFEEGRGTSPEELVAAGLAGCYAMALSAAIEAAGHAPRRVHARAKAHVGETAGGPAITRIELVVEAAIPGMQTADFQRIAAETRRDCPVSRALAGTEIVLAASLV